jgi:dienelactone hydrolase
MMNLPADFPANREQWDQHKASYRQALWTLLGELPPLFTPEAETLYIEQRDGYTLSRLQFDNGAGAMVYGYLLLPDPLQAPVAAVLYHHYHGGKYWIGKDEVLDDPVSHQQRGAALAKQGYAVLCIDAYCFGERQHQGPAGKREGGAGTEQALFKHLLWNGSSLWGMMVRDDLLALNYLVSRPEIDPSRIAATGMSLGASRTTWLSALDERVKVTIPVAQMTRYRDYADQGDYSLHSFYYYLPGMLKSGIDMEIIVSLTAPRAQLVLIGDSDNLSPLSGIRKVDEVAKQVYDYYEASGAFETRLYPGLGHQFTQTMFTALLDALQRYL